jgi:bifunctional UDP-N-acetylglucosamine pyrophosphorylase/glucosamine-1-phosphate N-acetyltransferase|tara:strand:- start:2658 stop:4004 length:1347 start_codon:yes stop_codon:yes gene_type:complete
MDRPLCLVVLAAGQGSRMKSQLPKVLHKVAGRPMIDHVLAAGAQLNPEKVVVVVGPGMAALEAAVAPHVTALQAERRGTADALKAARDALSAEISSAADVLVLYGDGPLITAETLMDLRDVAREEEADFVWLSFQADDPSGYGRMIHDDSGQLLRIVEEKEASAAQRSVDLCWSGLMLGRADVLFDLLEKVDNDNAKGEYYLTQLVQIANDYQLKVVSTEAPEDEILGVNSRRELAVAEAVMQDRLREAAMDRGATLIDPTTVWLSWDTQLGEDVIVGPNVHFGPRVVVGHDVEIRAFCDLEDCRIDDGARVGPFARLRAGAQLGAGAQVGNFVEIKNAKLGPGAAALHLSFIGDASVGRGSTIGAGSITCNYDGVKKSFTEIGDDVLVGSNSALVAPVKVGDGALIGAGSTITRDVEADALSLARARQEDRPGAAKTHRQARATKQE